MSDVLWWEIKTFYKTDNHLDRWIEFLFFDDFSGSSRRLWTQGHTGTEGATGYNGKKTQMMIDYADETIWTTCFIPCLSPSGQRRSHRAWRNYRSQWKRSAYNTWHELQLTRLRAPFLLHINCVRLLTGSSRGEGQSWRDCESSWPPTIIFFFFCILSDVCKVEFLIIICLFFLFLYLNRDFKVQGYVCTALSFSVDTSASAFTVWEPRSSWMFFFFIRDLLDLVDPPGFQWVFHLLMSDQMFQFVKVHV